MYNTIEENEIVPVSLGDKLITAISRVYIEKTIEQSKAILQKLGIPDADIDTLPQPATVEEADQILSAVSTHYYEIANIPERFA